MLYLLPQLVYFLADTFFKELRKPFLLNPQMHKSASFDAPLILAFLLHGAYHVCDDCFIDVSFSGRPCVCKGSVCLFRSSEDSALWPSTPCLVWSLIFSLSPPPITLASPLRLFAVVSPVPLTAGLGPQWSSMWPFLIFFRPLSLFAEP